MQGAKEFMAVGANDESGHDWTQDHQRRPKSPKNHESHNYSELLL